MRAATSAETAALILGVAGAATGVAVRTAMAVLGLVWGCSWSRTAGAGPEVGVVAGQLDVLADGGLLSRV